MKTLLLVTFWCVAASTCRAEPDGLYEVSEDGRPIRPLEDRIDEALATSQANDNAQYQILLKRSTAFSIPEERIALVLDGKLQRMAGWGSDPTGHSLSVVLNADRLPAIERLFSTKVHSRRHPGHLVRVQFVPQREKFAPGEPVLARLRLTNVGDKAFTFMNGGRNRGARNNQFGFTADDGQRMLPDIGNPVHFGGLASFQTVKPGETFELEVDLGGWFKFPGAGVYRLCGTYAMEFVDPPGPGGATIWQDVVGAEFDVTIEDALATQPKKGEAGK